jgi:excisionase family DNA binding protein
MSADQPNAQPLQTIRRQLRTVISLLEELTDRSETPRLLTREDAADRLSVSVRKLDALEEAGKIQAIRIGRCVRYHPEIVERFIRRRANKD